MPSNYRHKWLALAAYAALALLLVTSLAQRLWKRARIENPQPMHDESDFLAWPLPAEPWAANPSASRLVRWCSVKHLLEQRCARCHSTPATLGAPFPLLTYADTRRAFPEGSDSVVLDRMAHAIRHRIMPPLTLPVEPPVQPLSEAEKDLLLVWIEEGGLAFGGEQCRSATSGAKNRDAH